MKGNVIFRAVALAAWGMACVWAGEPLQSGPQVGASPKPFDPLHITGVYAGEKACLI